MEDDIYKNTNKDYHDEQYIVTLTFIKFMAIACAGAAALFYIYV